MSGLITDGVVEALRARQISEETCQVFGYQKATHKGKAVQVAPYYDDKGRMVAQKVRTATKGFSWVGDPADALPFGAQAWPKSGRMIVVTEGEIDALTMSQVQGNKWPVVSIGCGAGPQVKKYMAANRDYFLGFEKVILMFDSDTPGRTAAVHAAEVLGARAHIAELPSGFKDANEMLLAGKTAELINAMWKATPYRPDGLVGLEDVKAKAQDKPTVGLSWPWPHLTELTGGIQQPYIYTFGGATGCGKTDILREIAKHLLIHHKVPLGIFSLEEEPHVTAMGLASKIAGQNLHTPEGYDAEKFEAAWQALSAGGKVHFYDSFGFNEWDSIRDKIEYLHHSEGVSYFILDHLTALATGEEDERKALEVIMGEMSSMVTRLGLTIFLVSHLATPEGKPHEEGGRVMTRHFKGSRAIGQWSFGAIGLERNQQADDMHERHTTVVRMLKLRGFGWNVGKCTSLTYTPSTGLLEEQAVTPGMPPANPFESSDGTEGKDF